MKYTLIRFAAGAAFCALPSVCQEKAPVYRVTVIQHTVDSVNYQYHSGPTRIDFRGTVLLPAAKGDATVDPQKGRTAIDARFDGLQAPQRFGAEYLSYVLWAVTPDGASRNLGEIIPNGSNRAHLPVTTDLQAFGLIVTAEPYAAVRHPSDVVVLENYVRPDTVGQIQPVEAKVELMPRGQYTWNVPAGETAAAAGARKVSMGRYQAVLQVYEAQNALGIAQAAGAEKYAPDVYAKAQQELQEAQRLQSARGADDRVVQFARAATEIAEDARILAERRGQEAAIAAARQETAEARQARQQAETAAEQERERANRAQAQAQLDREARVRAEMTAQAASARSEQAAAAVAQAAPPPQPAQQTALVRDAAARENRTRLWERMNSAMVTRDTPRGLDATLGDNDFEGARLRPGPAAAVSQLAAALASQPGLRISVEGNADTAESSPLARRRADAVAAALIGAGVPARQVSSEDLGNSRLLVSNATERGRTENRRVEIVISGDAIGTVPSWDRTYPLSFNRLR
jgi:outer membrane protein OmpA-like peptidoglycan-associated protein